MPDVAPPPVAAPQARAHSRGDRWLVLGAVCLAGLGMPLAFTGPPVALSAIARDLGGDPAMLAWIVNGFMLAFGGVVMAAGTLADLHGRKRMFGIGLASFSLVSFALGFAPDVLWLDGLRAVQGVAAALTLSAGAASLAQEFEGHARTRAYSLLGTTFGLGLAFGPLLSASLVAHFGWRSVFVSGGVIALLALLFGVPRMRESRDPDARGLDWPGTLSFTFALVAFTFAVVEAPQRGWGSGLVLGLLAASAIALGVFVAVERRVPRPMLDLSLFRYPRFVGVQALPLATAFCYVVLLIQLPIRFVGIEGRGEVTAGLMMIPLSAPMLVVPLLGAMLARRISAAALSGVGLAIAAAGLAWLSRIAPGAPAATLAWPLIVIGIGSGLPWGLMDGLSVSVVPKERAGMATGIFTTTRVAGEAIILAAAGAALTAFAQGGLSGQAGADAGRYLAAGDLARASLHAPRLSREGLALVHAHAFDTLLLALAALTLLLGLASYVLLRERAPRASAAEPCLSR
ncbi:MFS transporter [Luteimonas aquatica]|uniref:MFS transporter n=1 Tax=Luteimonas aquatica TaxID=450364 RepID=UPI001F581B45|nr:MFS transporter [Luteimonas aquatica]